MSCSYYGLKEPITSVQAATAGGHVLIKLWVNHAFCGSLTLGIEEQPQVLRLFFDDRHDQGVARMSNGELHLTHRYLDPTTQVLSEYGELTTIAELQMKAHAKENQR